jgi:hypothetical protein
MQVGSTLPAGPGAACTADAKLSLAAIKINPPRTVEDRLASPDRFSLHGAKLPCQSHRPVSEVGPFVASPAAVRPIFFEAFGIRIERHSCGVAAKLRLGKTTV